MRVMIVDDEPFIREGLKRLIDWRKYDFSVEAEAGNALEALSILKKNKFNMLLVDIRMPGMSGLELIETIKNEKLSKAHIVILTGFADFEYARTAMRLGISDYLLKPIQTEELINVIEKVRYKNTERIDKLYSEQKEILMELLDEKKDPEEISEVLAKQKDIEPLIDAVKKSDELRRVERRDIGDEVDAYVTRHYRENISLKQLGELFHVNNVYLGQLFKKRHDMLFKDYVTYMRIKDAEDMLLHSNKRVYEIAKELGFSNADVFISRFVQHKGVTPNQFRIKSRMKNEK